MNITLRTKMIFAAALMLFALDAAAVTPAPVGGYPNYNTATGDNALFFLTTGYDNVADGNASLYYCTIGQSNTAIGSFALLFNGVGSFNTAIGDDALYNLNHIPDQNSWNTAVGFQALYSMQIGERNIAIGNGAGFNFLSGNDNIYIGNAAIPGEFGAIRIGTTGTHTSAYIAGVYANIISGRQVVIGPDGKLGVKPLQPNADAKIDRLARAVRELQQQVAALQAK